MNTAEILFERFKAEYFAMRRRNKWNIGILSDTNIVSIKRSDIHVTIEDMHALEKLICYFDDELMLTDFYFSRKNETDPIELYIIDCTYVERIPVKVKETPYEIVYAYAYAYQ